jgi:hypothetical protein
MITGRDWNTFYSRYFTMDSHDGRRNWISFAVQFSLVLMTGWLRLLQEY